MSSEDTLAARVRRVRERHDATVPALVHPDWAEDLPWLVQGTTTRGPRNRPFDLGLFGDGPPGESVHGHWGRLLAVTSMPGVVHARQLHEAEVRFHSSARTGAHVVRPCDGHVTDRAGLLLAVTVADCVPIFLVAPSARAVAVLHAGWRGAAAAVLESGLEVLVARVGVDLAELRMHLGPAICGSCYEVGPEVFGALERPRPAGPKRIDLRGVLGERALAAGVDPERITISEHCTRCTDSGLFSHRGGDSARQVGYVGIRV